MKKETDGDLTTSVEIKAEVFDPILGLPWSEFYYEKLKLSNIGCVIITLDPLNQASVGVIEVYAGIAKESQFMTKCDNQGQILTDSYKGVYNCLVPAADFVTIRW